MPATKVLISEFSLTHTLSSSHSFSFVDTQIEMNPELTSVDILDYTLTNHINFEAEINFLNKGENIVQVISLSFTSPIVIHL